MVEVTVLFKSETKPQKEDLIRDLKWYDDIRGEMLIFRGGKLGFEYKEDGYLVSMGETERLKRGIASTYRMLPKVESLSVVNYNHMKTTTNEKDVKKWLDNYVNYSITNVGIVGFDGRGITVNLPDNDLDDFLYQAERNGFRTVIE